MEAVLVQHGSGVDVFGYRGYGLGWSTIRHHINQTLTPRMKQASVGARCMRFK